MRENRRQVLTTTIRLPDGQQAASLRLLESARQATNSMLETLWPHLAEFEQGQGPAWKQVSSLLGAPAAHPSRVWRCEAETAGRILRSQAARKAAFDRLHGVLSEELIVPAKGGRTARKNRRELNARLAALREELGSDADKLMLLLNVAEQACNFYLAYGCFPDDYSTLQRVPVLAAGVLTFAGDDGPRQGQAYRLAVAGTCLEVALKVPGEAGGWKWLAPFRIELPDNARELLARGELLAPQLRVMTKANGEAVAVLDLPVEVPVAGLPKPEDCARVLAFDWGVRKLLTMVVVGRDGQQVSRPLFFDSGGLDGKQARLRRQIDLLKARRDKLPENAPRRTALDQEIEACWLAFTRRNQALAHLAANLLVLVATVYGCRLIVGEDLVSLKTMGRGRDVKGRWRNWRNNTTLRSAITNLLRYKARLAGIRLRFEFPRKTSHTCPRCGKPAHTFRSPQPGGVCEWGAWLRCESCGWNGSRDYAGALNIARLGIGYLVHQRAIHLADPILNPVSYSGTGAALPFPPPGVRLNGLVDSCTTCSVHGWLGSVTLKPLFHRRQCVDSYT
jgi:putative transposase